MLRFVNNYSARLVNAILATDTTIVVDTALPALAAGDTYRLTIADRAGTQPPEIIEVTAVAADGVTLTVNRGVEGTAAQDWAANTPVELRWTAGEAEKLVSDLGALQALVYAAL